MRYLVFILLFISVGLEAQNINQLRPDTAAGSIPMTIEPYFRQAYARPQTVADTMVRYMSLDTFFITDDSVCLRVFPNDPILCRALPPGIAVPDTCHQTLWGKDSMLFLTYSCDTTIKDTVILKYEQDTTGASTYVNGGTGISVSGSGTLADPYVIDNTAIADGSETVVTAGTNISVTGSGTSGSPYVITNTLTAPDGSETVVTSGTAISVTGTGTSGDPYVVTNTLDPDGTSIANTQVAFSNGSTLIGDGDLTFVQGTNTFNTINENVNGTLNLLAVGGLRNKAGTNDWRQYAVGNNLYHEPETVDGQIFHRNFANTTTMTFSSSTGNLNTLGYMQPQGGIRDPGNSLGSTGQILSSTGSTIDWIDPTSIDFGIAVNLVPYGTGTGLTSEAAFNYNPSNNLLTSGHVLSQSLTINSTSGITFDLTTGPDIDFRSNGTNFYTDFTTSPVWYIRNNTGTSPSDVLRFDMGANIAYLYDTLQLNNGLRDYTSSSGTSGQFLKSTGTDVVWDDLPSGGDGIYGGSGTVGGGSSVTAAINSGTFFSLDYNGGDDEFGVSSAIAFINHTNGVKIGDQDDLTNELLIDGYTGGIRVGNEQASPNSRIGFDADGDLHIVAQHGTNVADINLTAEDNMNFSTTDNFDVDADFVDVTGTSGVLVSSSGNFQVNANSLLGATSGNQFDVRSSSLLSVAGHEDYAQTSAPGLGSQLTIYGDNGFASDGDLYLNARGESGSDLSLIASENVGIVAGAAGSGVISTTGNFGINGTPGAYALYVNGTQFSTSASTFTTSDKKIKRNIRSIRNPLDKLMQLKPVTYEYKDDYLKSSNQQRKTMKGFIAQDYRKVFAEDVVDNDGTLAIDSQALIPYLVAAVQELRKENDELRKEIQKLKK